MSPCRSFLCQHCLLPTFVLPVNTLLSIFTCQYIAVYFYLSIHCCLFGSVFDLNTILVCPYLPICRSIYLSICLSIYISICPSMDIFIIYLSIYECIYLSIYLSIYLYIHHLSVERSTYLSIRLSTYKPLSMLYLSASRSISSTTYPPPIHISPVCLLFAPSFAPPPPPPPIIVPGV